MSGDGAAGVPFGRTPEVSASALTAGFDTGALSRWPYPEAPELRAHDSADALLLDTLHAWLEVHPGGPDGPAADEASDVVVLDDRHGALALPLLRAGHRVRVRQDGLARERSLTANLDRLGSGAPGTLHRGAIDAGLLAGAGYVLLVLPRSLDALEQSAHLVAEHAAEDVILLAGGRDKHMTPRQNAVLGRYFASVVSGRGRAKSRVLTARGPVRGRPAPFPRTARHELPDVGPVTLAAYGATFGGSRVDPGTRFLLEHLGTAWPPRGDGAPLAAAVPLRAVDVGCGNGTVAVYLALRARQAGEAAGTEPDAGLGHATVLATDQSADACRSTALTLAHNGVRDAVEVRRDDALASFPRASEHLLVLNPPFHAGNAVDPRVAVRLFEASARVLRPGGELWCVWNSHLQYRPDLERLVGPTRQLARNRTFTVTASTRR